MGENELSSSFWQEIDSLQQWLKGFFILFENLLFWNIGNENSILQIKEQYVYISVISIPYPLYL